MSLLTDMKSFLRFMWGRTMPLTLVCVPLMLWALWRGLFHALGTWDMALFWAALLVTDALSFISDFLFWKKYIKDST